MLRALHLARHISQNESHKLVQSHFLGIRPSLDRLVHYDHRDAKYALLSRGYEAAHLWHHPWFFHILALWNCFCALSEEVDRWTYKPIAGLSLEFVDRA